MKTLEELRNNAEKIMFGETIEGSLPESLARLSFRAGWDAAVKELTRWRNPTKELPDGSEDVLIKTTMCRRYCVAFRNDGSKNYRWQENNGSIDDDMVIGWRPIINVEKI